MKANSHSNIRQRIVQFLAADQLNALSDTELMHQAFQVLTIDNVGGTLHLADGSFISMRQCIDEFALTSKTRDGATIRRLLKERLNELQDIAAVEKYKNHGDDIDLFIDDDFSDDGILDFSDEVSSSLKRQMHTMLAGATQSCCGQTSPPTNKQIGGQCGDQGQARHLRHRESFTSRTSTSHERTQRRPSSSVNVSGECIVRICKSRLSEFISVFKQPTSYVVFRPTIHPCHLRIMQSQLWGCAIVIL